MKWVDRFLVVLVIATCTVLAVAGALVQADQQACLDRGGRIERHYYFVGRTMIPRFECVNDDLERGGPR